HWKNLSIAAFFDFILQKAKMKAFEIINCKLEDPRVEYDEGEYEIPKDKNLKLDLICVSGDKSIFEKFCKKSDYSEFSKCEHLSYKYEKICKLQMSITDVKIMPDFKNALDEFIESKDYRVLKEIEERYGTFTPKTIQFGGRIDRRNGNISHIYGGNTEYLRFHPDMNAWNDSLNDPAKWQPVDYKDICGILKLLDEELQNKLIKARGKIILYKNSVNEIFRFRETTNHAVRVLDIPREIFPENITNFTNFTDFQVFATLVNMTDESDILTFRLFRKLPGKSTKIIVHCAKSKEKKLNRHLKIGWMVVGHCPDVIEMVKSLNDGMNKELRLFSFNSNITPQNNQSFAIKILDTEFENIKPGLFERISDCTFTGTIETDSFKIQNITDFLKLRLM
ncbi:335_t:CDS:2, partial [Acaulospora colombiana]